MKTLPNVKPFYSSMTSSFAGKDPFVGDLTGIFNVAFAILNDSARLLCAKWISYPFFKEIKSILNGSSSFARGKIKVYFHSKDVLLYNCFEVLELSL